MTTLSSEEDLHSLSPWMRLFEIKIIGDFNRIIATTLSCVLPAYIIGAERSGVVSFLEELNISARRSLDNARSHEEKSYINYPISIKENIEFLNRLKGIEQRTSELSQTHPDIIALFDRIAGGHYQRHEFAGMRFKPEGAEAPLLTMSASSSSVRSLVHLSYFLKHIARPGMLLVIDEPEQNLHPRNQRLMARLLVRLVGAGLKVMVTTHSNYIIREINTLVMLNTQNEQTAAIAKEYGYEEKDQLAPERLSLYTLTKEPGTDKVIFKEAEVTEEGVAVETFDRETNELNELQYSLYDALLPKE